MCDNPIHHSPVEKNYHYVQACIMDGFNVLCAILPSASPIICSRKIVKNISQVSFNMGFNKRNHPQNTPLNLLMSLNCSHETP